ncbi:hypothetical protein [Pseudophaeobacter sp.]|uniref:hypothetical protein n=1 Tax=Pseudophaeobacter sp. TaxID=1971739 RepID=UPI00329A0279
MQLTSPFSSILSRGFATALLALTPQLARAETGSLLVELNKMEEIEAGGCRAFFLFRNQTGKSFADFEMSLAILDGEGIIDRLLSVDASPLPVQRTTLKLFEIPAITCSNISEILLHDVTSCKPQNEAEMDCFPILTLGSRSSAKLVK